MTYSNFPLRGPLSLAELLDRAFRLYQVRFGVLVLTAAVFLIPTALIAGMISGQSNIGTLALFQQLFSDPTVLENEEMLLDLQRAQMNMIGWIYIMSFVTLVVYGVVNLALTAQVVAILHGEKLSVWQGIRRGLSRFWAYAVMNILRGLTLMAIYMGVIFLVFCVIFGIGLTAAGGFAAFFEGSSGPPNDATVVGLLIGLVCFYLLVIALIIAPITYVSARWLVATVAIVAENEGPTAGLGTSWRLTKGHARRAFFYTFLLGVLYATIFSVVAFTIQWGLLLLLSFAPLLAGALSGALSGLLTVLWSPLSIAAIVLFYYDLRVRQEGYDLTQRIYGMATALEREAGQLSASQPSVGQSAMDAGPTGGIG